MELNCKRENRTGNQKWTIHERHQQNWMHKTQDEDKQNKNNTALKTKKVFLKNLLVCAC
jgi:hypothetical protein